MKKAKNDIDFPFNYGSDNISFQKYSPLSSAAIRSSRRKTLGGGGRSAWKVNLRWRMILSMTLGSSMKEMIRILSLHSILCGYKIRFSKISLEAF